MSFLDPQNEESAELRYFTNRFQVSESVNELYYIDKTTSFPKRNQGLITNTSSISHTVVAEKKSMISRNRLCSVQQRKTEGGKIARLLRQP